MIVVLLKYKTCTLLVVARQFDSNELLFESLLSFGYYLIKVFSHAEYRVAN